MNAKTNIEFKIIKDIQTAKFLWDFFSPQETIFDSWEFRYCFYKYFNNELFFYTGFEKEKPVILLPLQTNIENQCLEFFGGDYMEDNRVMYLPEYVNHIPSLFNMIDRPARLEYIRASDSFTEKLPLQDYKYALPLKGISSYQDYISNYYTGKDAREMQRKVRNIEKIKLDLSVNEQNAIEWLFKFNIEYFKERSYFNRPHIQSIFKDILNLSFKPIVMSYGLNGETKATTLSLIYNDTLASFNAGIAIDAPKNIREYIYLKKIDLAAQLKLKSIDFFIGDYGWKERWHFHKIPQYVFRNI